MLSDRSQFRARQDTLKRHIAQQQTHPYPSIGARPHAILTTPVAGTPDKQGKMATHESMPRTRSRLIGTIVVGVIALILYFIWRPAAQAPQANSLTQSSMGTITAKPLISGPTDAPGNPGGTIQVYIIGAVQHPGVYTLANNARIYQLLQAAGGTLANANLTAINMAARLSDGQEIYLPHIGETPIAAMGGMTSGVDPATLVNINSASADQLRQSLHLSSKSAQAIITYRLQHGAFSSVNALAQLLSKAVYDRIKDKVTI